MSDISKNAMGALSSLWNRHKGALANLAKDVSADVNNIKKSLKFKKSK